jgi:hypothetical protein
MLMLTPSSLLESLRPDFVRTRDAEETPWAPGSRLCEESGHLIDRREIISTTSPQVIRHPQLHIMLLRASGPSCDGYSVVISFTN